MIEERCGIKGEVCMVLETVDRAFGGGSKIHASKCPWWKKRTTRSCDCGRIRFSIYENIITDEGDRHYAEGFVREVTSSAPAFATVFNDMTVATAVTTAFGTKAADSGDVTTIPTGGTKDIDSYGTSYPIVNDPDTNNPGVTVAVDTVTWRTTYTTAQGNGTLVGVCIHASGALFGGANVEPLLMSVDLSPTIVKTSGMALAVFVNHAFEGV